MKMLKLGFGTLMVLCAACSAGANNDAATGDDGAELRASKRIVARVDRTDLVTDATDSNLVNAWGLAFNPAGPVWISNNGTGTSTVYDDTGKLLLTVTVPNVAGSTDASEPTGQVFNGSSAFESDKFIFVTQAGTVAGWQPNAKVVTRSDQSARSASYTGLAIADDKLFASDFHNGKIDVFDKNYALIDQDGFSDPNLPSNYSPFNVQALDGKIFVVYAQINAERADEVHGAGKGAVDMFDTSGKLLARIVKGGTMNSPWGVTLAPASFGALEGKLLVGNIGDGKISVFDLPDTSNADGYGYGYGSSSSESIPTAKQLGMLGDDSGKVLVVDGLWGLAVSPSGNLSFAAGPSDEKHGAYGTLQVH